MSDSNSKRKVAVIGGGISGLAAVHRVVELAPSAEVVLFEASDKLGGVLRTERHDDFLVERSADMFTTKDPWAIDLCERIGIADQLIETDSTNRRSFIVHRGRLVETPSGFTLMSPSRVWPILKTPLLSIRGKLRLACEYFVSKRTDEADESLASFTKRRMGRDVYERIVQPMIGGIYTADPEKLSMRATMKQFVDMEQEYGSLIVGMRRQQKAAASKASGARYNMFLTPRDGMSSLVDAIAKRLPPDCVRRNTPVESLARNDGHWTIETKDAKQLFDDVIVALPAPRAAKLVTNVSSELASDLSDISYASAVVVVIGCAREAIEHPLNGFGFVVPMVERRKILACSFSSIKFPGRAPNGQILMRTFVGGGTQPELAELPDDEVVALVRDELRELIGMNGDVTFARVARWRETMPQYHVGHLDLVDRIEQRVSNIPNFELAGNAYRGVGIPFCIHSGEQAAEAIFK